MSLTQQVERCWQALAIHWQQHYPELGSDAIGEYARQFLCESAFSLGCRQIDLNRGWGLWQATSGPQVQMRLTAVVNGIFQNAIASHSVIETLDLPLIILDPWFSYLNAHPPAPEHLGQIYEIALHQSLHAETTGHNRKRQGSYFTPVDIADRMVQATLIPALQSPVLQSINAPPKLLDPACGGGIFLLRAYRELWRQRDRYPSLKPLTAAQLMEQCLFGIDLDQGALRVTHLALLLLWLGQVKSKTDLKHPQHPQHPPQLERNLQWGNALLVDVRCQEHGAAGDRKRETPKSKLQNPKSVSRNMGSPSVAIAADEFDIVVSNPPYLDAEWMSKTDPALRAYCTRHYQSARGNWDLFCPFVERGLQLCRPGGWLAMVVPNKLASAVYAAPLRRLLTQKATLRALWDYAHTAPFSAAVYPLVFVAQLRGSKASVDLVQHSVELSEGTLPYPHFQSPSRAANQPWPTRPNADMQVLIHRWQQTLPVLEEQFQVTGAATVAEAYQLRSLLRDTPQPKPGDLTFVNSGTLDRYRFLWGLKRCRYLGQRYQHPVVPLALQGRLSPRRLGQAQQPKIITAGLSRYLEGVLDDKGTVLAGKSTCVILGETSLWALLGILNSTLMRGYISQVFGGQHLQGGYLTIGPPLLRQLPLPTITPDTPLSLALCQQVRCRQALQHQLDKYSSPNGNHTRRLTESKDLSRHNGETTDAIYGCQKTLKAQMSSTEHTINRLVGKLYGLTEREIAWFDACYGLCE